VNSSRTGEDGGLAGIEDLINRTRPLGRRVLWDVHVGDKPKTVREWSVFFDHWRALLARLQSQMRAVVLEENGHDHGMLRALGHATYSNMIHRHADVVTISGYTNALQAWQGSNKEHAFPQGQIFMLPNTTWGQPTFWVIQMIADSFRPRVLQLDPDWQTYGDGSKVDVVAVSSEDGASLVLRAANWDESAATLVRVVFHDSLKKQQPTAVSVLLLQGTSGDPLEENDPGMPHRVSPQNRTELFHAASQTLTLPALSYVVVTFEWAPRSEQAVEDWKYAVVALACVAAAVWGTYALAAAYTPPLLDNHQ